MQHHITETKPPRRRRRSSRWIVLLFAVLLAGGCSSVPTDPTEIEQPDNPDDDGEPKG